MSLEENVQGYFDLLSKGQMMDAFEKYYAEDVVMQENNEDPRVGKEANRNFEIEYMSSIEEVHGSEIKNVAINQESGTVFIQSFMDATFKDFGRSQMEEVQVQTWKNGQIVNEKFFYNRG
ncbi:MAG: nuclear transport factor 2 family protein [Bacteroidales bacterium]|nr:nuclear transport factor 2 family protein [Bacteroidales bacterium]